VPRFFFNLHDGVHVPDSEGVVLPDLEAARKEALRGARDIMASDVKQGILSLDEFIVVIDEQGREVHRQSFADAIRIEQGRDAA
jgi:hypothetical protein